MTPEEARANGYTRKGPDSPTAGGLSAYIIDTHKGSPPRVIVDNSNHPGYLEHAGGARFTVWEQATR